VQKLRHAVASAQRKLLPQFCSDASVHMPAPSQPPVFASLNWLVVVLQKAAPHIVDPIGKVQPGEP
jgi:hypothetical protein